MDPPRARLARADSEGFCKAVSQCFIIAATPKSKWFLFEYIVIFIHMIIYIHNTGLSTFVKIDMYTYNHIYELRIAYAVM